MNIAKLRSPLTLAAFAWAAMVGGPLLASDAAQNGDKDEKDARKKPKITLRASPQTGFSPLRVVMSAELKGGDDDYADYYCPTIEWVWGDDTRAESSADCDPYQAGKSEIRRRYTLSRVFNVAGEYRVEVRLKQKDRVVGTAGTIVRVQRGIRDCCS